jgi:hypothetical protein
LSRGRRQPRKFTCTGCSVARTRLPRCDWALQRPLPPHRVEDVVAGIGPAASMFLEGR